MGPVGDAGTTKARVPRPQGRDGVGVDFAVLVHEAGQVQVVDDLVRVVHQACQRGLDFSPCHPLERGRCTLLGGLASLLGAFLVGLRRLNETVVLSDLRFRLLEPFPQVLRLAARLADLIENHLAAVVVQVRKQLLERLRLGWRGRCLRGLCGDCGFGRGGGHARINPPGVGWCDDATCLTSPYPACAS